MGRNGVRYRHVLAKARGGKQPDCVIGVATESIAEPVKGRQGVERLRLVRWFTSCESGLQGQRASRVDSAGSDCSSFWRALERAGSRYRHILLVSSNAVTDWALLGLWEALEDERLRIAGANQQGAYGATGSNLGSEQRQEGTAKGLHGESKPRHANSAAGFIVTEDPPSILYAYLREGGALVRWVDIRNYGIRSVQIPAGPSSASGWLLSVATGMIRELTARQLGGLKDTAGAQAMYSFRFKHLKNLIVCHTVESVLQLEKDAYYSGRCECGRIGHTEGPVYELDLRGAYTHVCAVEPVPVRLRHYNLSPATGEMPQTGTGRGMVATVCIETGEPAYPLRRDGLTVFPTGRFLTTLCGPELQDALDKDRVRYWKCWAEYDLAPALASYADDVYALRCSAESAGDQRLAAWAKALAVSIVGKLGQRGRHWHWLPGQQPRYYYDQYYQRHTDGRVHRFQEIAGQHRMESVEGWAYDACPAIAGWICSAARLRLLHILRCAGYSECWYCDTDCVFTTDVGYNRLVSAGWVRPGQLGYLQVKGCHEWFEPRGVKSYRLPSRRVDSGRSANEGTGGTSSEQARHSVWMSTYLDRGARPQAERITTTWQKVTPYRHGQITMGGRTKPWHYWEE